MWSKHSLAGALSPQKMQEEVWAYLWCVSLGEVRLASLTSLKGKCWKGETLSSLSDFGTLHLGYNPANDFSPSKNPQRAQRKQLSHGHILWLSAAEMIRKPLYLPTTHACKNLIRMHFCSTSPMCWHRGTKTKQNKKPASSLPNHICWQLTA